MRYADLQLLLDDIERVAIVARQLLRDEIQTRGQASGATPQGSDTAPRKDSRLRVGSVASRVQDSCLRTPGRTIAIATGIGLLVGCLLTRRPRRSPLGKP